MRELEEGVTRVGSVISYQVMKFFDETDKLMVVKVVGFASTYAVTLILKYARSL